MRTRAGFFLNKRLICVAECFHRTCCGGCGCSNNGGCDDDTTLPNSLVTRLLHDTAVAARGANEADTARDSMVFINDLYYIAAAVQYVASVDRI
eukprot:scaffold85141_cov51-Attheya_sp.AAC.4